MTHEHLTELIERRSAAIRAKDLDLLMSFYAPGIVYFDVVPPLRYVGSAALRDRFTHWFDGFAGPIRQDPRDLTLAGGGDVVVAHVLIRAGGTLTSGTEISRWVRATSCFQRFDDTWLVTHEHVSLPVDLATGTTPADLRP